jgi:hypothetical protein
MYVPWRKISSWYCSACGECCFQYKVPLRFYEYLKLRNTGFVEEKVGKFYIRKIGRQCPFQIGRLCSLQGSNKPIACKLFPFSILKKGKEEALYEYQGKEIYVYVNTSCPNVILGKTRNMMEKLVNEAAQLYFGEKEWIDLITSPLPSIPNTFVEGSKITCRKKPVSFLG